MPLNTPAARVALYYPSLAALLGAFLLCARLTASKYGRVLTAIRDAESRVRFLGYDVTRHKLFVFTLSAVLAGIAGALYVPQVGIINPGEFSPGNSIEAVVWVAAGGRGTLLGALLGAFAINGLKTWLTTVAPDLWLFALGGLFVAVTLFLPRGLVGLLWGWGR
jgi:urea transport system permease protein